MAAPQNGRSLRNTFHIKLARDWYEKLVWEHEQLESQGFMGGTDFRFRLINFCITAWSMIDWLHAAMRDAGSAESLTKYKARVRTNVAMDFCRHVTDSCKHAGIDHQVNENLATSFDDVFASFRNGRSESSAALTCHEARQFLKSELERLNRQT